MLAETCGATLQFCFRAVKVPPRIHRPILQRVRAKKKPEAASRHLRLSRSSFAFRL
jgi:hypothetical protein